MQLMFAKLATYAGELVRVQLPVASRQVPRRISSAHEREDHLVELEVLAHVSVARDVVTAFTAGLPGAPNGSSRVTVAGITFFVTSGGADAAR